MRRKLIPELFSPELLVIYALFLLAELLTFRTGLWLEEFRTPWVLNQMRLGHLPFRDFIWEYGALGPILWYSITKMTGLELVAMRAVVIILALPCLWLSYKLARRFAPEWPAAFIALAASGVLTFPIYSYEHALSVPPLLAAAFTLVRWLESKKQAFLWWSSFFSVLTVLIRPLPTGIVLIIAVFLTTLLAAWQEKHWKRLREGLIYLGLTTAGIFIFTASYTMIFHFPWARWEVLDLISPFVSGNQPLIVMKIPNSAHDISAFIKEVASNAVLNQKMLFVRLGTLLNLLAGDFTWWVVFILPAAYLIFTAYRSRAKRIPFSEPNVFLALLSVGLGLYHHFIVNFSRYPDTAFLGYLWALGAFFILPPGLILGLGLVFQAIEKMRLTQHAAALSIAILAAFLVTVPKIWGLRYLFMPMEVGEISPVRHIYLNDYYSHSVMPAMAYLRENKDRLPEFLFTSRPELQVLAPQKAAFPEFYYIGYLPDHFPPKSGMLPRSDNPEAVDVADLIILRLKKLKPMILTDAPLSDGQRAWAHYAVRHYNLHRQFSTQNQFGTSSALNLYLPKP